MGVDLRLLPFDADHKDLAFSHTLLSCERRSALWEAIAEHCAASDVPDCFSSFCNVTDEGETMYGVTTTTPHGERLQWTTAEALLQPAVMAHVDDPKNRAIWAYLAALPPATKVALFWH